MCVCLSFDDRVTCRIVFGHLYTCLPALSFVFVENLHFWFYGIWTRTYEFHFCSTLLFYCFYLLLNFTILVRMIKDVSTKVTILLSLFLFDRSFFVVCVLFICLYFYRKECTHMYVCVRVCVCIDEENLYEYNIKLIFVIFEMRLVFHYRVM